MARGRPRTRQETPPTTNEKDFASDRIVEQDKNCGPSDDDCRPKKKRESKKEAPICCGEIKRKATSSCAPKPKKVKSCAPKPKKVKFCAPKPKRVKSFAPKPKKNACSKPKPKKNSCSKSKPKPKPKKSSCGCGPKNRR